jgi:Transposase DDE domain
VLRIAVPRRGRAVLLLHPAYDRDDLPSGKSQNQFEEEALAAVLAALPAGVRPVILADHGFARASFLEWLQQHALDYVVRIDMGTCITQTDGRRWKLGAEGLQQSDLRFHPAVRYGLYHGRPRDLPIHLALTWRLPRHQQRDRRQAKPEQPWYLATNQLIAAQAAPGTVSVSGSRRASRTPSHASVSSTSRSALPPVSRAWCWPSPSPCAGSHSPPCPRAAPSRPAGMPQWLSGDEPASSVSPSYCSTRRAIYPSLG